jgi:hypothetical protein
MGVVVRIHDLFHVGSDVAHEDGALFFPTGDAREACLPIPGQLGGGQILYGYRIDEPDAHGRWH